MNQKNRRAQNDLGAAARLSKNRFACDAIDRARPSQRWKVRLKSDLFGVQFRRGLIIYELLK